MGRREQGRGRAELKPAPARGAEASAAAPGGDGARAGTVPHWAEALAAQRLGAAGWRVLARNYRLRGGELDLVCEDEQGVVVFVEVKQRRRDAYGGAALAIDRRKLARLRRTAAHYLAYALRRPDARVRFDAVLVSGTEDSHRVVHLRDVA